MIEELIKRQTLHCPEVNKDPKLSINLLMKNLWRK